MMARQRVVRGLLRSAVRGGSWNTTWVGDARKKPLLLWRFPLLELLLKGLDEADTQSISQRFYAGGTASEAVLPKPGAICETVDAFNEKLEISGRNAYENAAGSSADPSFSIVIPFARHAEFFPACLRSVAALKAQGASSLQIVVANDDPAIEDHQLLDMVPDGIRDRVLVLPRRSPRGVSRALNDAVSKATNEWILFLDCDDLLEPDALVQLARYIREYPQIRYISSCIVDIDEQDRILRYRHRSAFGPSTLLYAGMQAGHLKSIRRDVFETYGAWNETCDGAQDYEFALRVSFFEPLLFIPEYLYRYRYHEGAFSVARKQQQDEVVVRIVRTYKCAAMIERGLLGLTIDFQGCRAAEWAASWEATRVEHREAHLEVNPGDLAPTLQNRRLLALEAAYLLMQLGATPWKSRFETRKS